MTNYVCINELCDEFTVFSEIFLLKPYYECVVEKERSILAGVTAKVEFIFQKKSPPAKLLTKVEKRRQ